MLFRLLTLFAFLSVILATEPPKPFGDHCIVGEESQYDPTKASLVPTYTVDLDKAPYERWLEVGKVYKPHINDLINIIKNMSFPFFHGKMIQIVDKYMAPWDNIMDQPYRDELKGLANATGLPLGEIVLYNVFYEIFSVCTSIVAEDPTHNLFHARNLDFGLFLGWNSETHDWKTTEVLRKLIINLEWKKNGKLLYKSVNFAGYTGILSAVKPEKFSITLNERYDLEGGYVGLIKWLLGMASNSKFAAWLTREVMEGAESYEQAYQMLSKTGVLSPVYYILGGNSTGQGAIIVRSLDTVTEERHLNLSNPDGWFLLQTNYDPSKPTLYLDDRCTPGKACMTTLGRNNVGFKGMYDVLSSKTNMNKLTAYTVLIEVRTGKMETYVRKCEDPCWPF